MIYDDIKALLIKLGWHIDYNAIPNKAGELREFINPVNGDKVAWIDAIFIQQELEQNDPYSN